MSESIRQAGYAPLQFLMGPPRAPGKGGGPEGRVAGGFGEALEKLEEKSGERARAALDANASTSEKQAGQGKPADMDADFLGRLFGLEPDRVKSPGVPVGAKGDKTEKEEDAAGFPGEAAAAAVAAVVSVAGPDARARGGEAADATVPAREAPAFAAPARDRKAAGDNPPRNESGASRNESGPQAGPPRTADGTPRPGGGAATAAPADSSAEKPGARLRHDGRAILGDGADHQADKPGMQDAAAGAKVKVVSVHSTPAPAAPLPMASPAAAVVDAIRREVVSPARGTPSPAPADGSAPAGGMLQEIRIQLQPASLGMVTARMRLAGDSLHVVLQADNADAHHRLRSDSDTIARSLRALGYDVDRVTVQPPAAQSPMSGNHNAASSGRDQPFQQAAGNNGGGEGSGSTGNGKREEHEGARLGAERPQQSPSSGSGLFI